MNTLKRSKNHIAALLALAVVALLGGAHEAMAQETPTSVITGGIDDIITEGTAVGVAALGVFIAFVTIMVIKKFFFAGK